MVQEKEIVSFFQGLGKFEIAITVVFIVNFIIEEKMKCLNSEVSCHHEFKPKAISQRLCATDK